MKKLLSLLLLTLCALSAAPAFAAYAYVGTVYNGSASNTLTWAPTAGNLCVLEIITSAGSGNPTVTAVIDNNSVSWTQAYPTTSIDGGVWWVTAYYKPNVESSVTGLTVTFTGGTPGTSALIGVQYSGIATSSPLIGTPVANYQATPGTGTNAVTVGPLNVTSQPALVLGIMGDTINDNTLTAGTGFTMRSNGEPSGDAVHVWVEDLRATTTGNQNATATALSSSSDFINMILSFAEPGAGATCTHAGWTASGALTVPTASVTSVWVPSEGKFDTVDCLSKGYWQSGGAIGVN